MSDAGAMGPVIAHYGGIDEIGVFVVPVVVRLLIRSSSTRGCVKNVRSVDSAAVRM